MADTHPTARLEAFCDGVFAIALTLLILDVKIPASEAIGSTGELWLALRHMAPSLFAFVLSFVIIFITWVNHHAALRLVNKSSSAKQAAAWEFLKFLDSTGNDAAWAIATGYMPIRKSSANSSEMQQYWQANPEFKVAYDQLATGPTNVATSGSVIGNYTGARDAMRDGENSMFLNGTDPKSALKSASKNATSAIDDYNSKLGVG